MSFIKLKLSINPIKHYIIYEKKRFYQINSHGRFGNAF